MKNFLKLVKTTILVTIIAVLSVACVNKDELSNHHFFNISQIELDPINAEATINKDTYNSVLTGFKNELEMVFANNIKEEVAILQYGFDYKITLIKYNLYDPIKTLETIKVKVEAATTTNILTGSFITKVNLVNKRKSIAKVVIPTKTFKDTVIDTTTFQNIIDELQPLVVDNITNIEPKAKLDIDYTIIFEGYISTQKVKKNNLGINNINVNAITYNNCYLKDNFSFKIIIE